MTEKQETKTILKENAICVVVPTYNNEGTITHVLDRIVPYSDDIIVVNDGSTDNTQTLLDSYKAESETCKVTVVSYPNNAGKGHALRSGFYKALELGFKYAITIDSDGQHYPEDIPLFINTFEQNEGALIVGNRKLVQKNMPGKNTFANYFSNFWFMLQTWQYLPDTQTGYRLYPLKKLSGLRFLTSRYEAELELLVFSSWKGTKLISTPIRVYYPPEGERVSHFRPLRDFGRISILNTVLCCLCLVYGWWAIIFNKIKALFSK